MAKSSEKCVPNAPVCVCVCVCVCFLAESTFRDIETVGDHIKAFLGLYCFFFDLWRDNMDIFLMLSF